MIWLIGLAMAAACVPVHTSVLHGSDLAAADSQFAGVDADMAFGYAPAPGTRRVISETEMARFAKRFAVSAVPHEVCFQYAMRHLDAAEIFGSIRAILPDAEVEILEIGKFEVPEGKIVFTLGLLPKPPIARPYEPVIWRGYIEYEKNRRFTIWAKVRVRTKDVEVARGDEVTVRVQAGGATIKIAARAETGASLGETVKLRNPKSGKVFEALVTGKGTANLEAQ